MCGRGRRGGGPPPVVLPLVSSHYPSAFTPSASSQNSWLLTTELSLSRDLDRKLALPSTLLSSSPPTAPSQTPQLHVETITPEIASKKVCRDTISELVTSYRESHLGKCLPVYDGRKSLHTAGSLPLSSKDFVAKLVDKLDSKDRKERKYNVAIKFADKADLHYLQQFLGGMQLDAPQETLHVLDVILRSAPSTNYVVVGRSFFSPSLGETVILGDGLKYWNSFYQSLRPTQMVLSLNVDKSARASCEPVLVSKFVEGYCNSRDLRRPLSDQDRIKVKKALKNIRVELVFRDGRQCKISGVSAQPLSPLMNALGSEVFLKVLPGIRFLEANVELYTWLSAMVVDSNGFRDVCQVRCCWLPVGFGGMKVDLMEYDLHALRYIKRTHLNNIGHRWLKPENHGSPLAKPDHLRRQYTRRNLIKHSCRDKLKESIFSMEEAMFSRDDLGTMTSVVQNNHERYQINLSFLSLPALQAGCDAMPVYLPMEVFQS
ncbi:hypothetical protein RHGRI_022199 [Rhododendron griersonianum]|uniref:Argonaute linker 1 domain-containing protein n=1 Tax=Rhododendron griersonianum TaxID=479676 RepID=A0AAV6JN25_9ERIC|nr:hypothetical protein RHGRI_022199 [Rhododendron griersonianum]